MPDSARMGGVIILTLIVGLALLAALLKSRAQKPGPQDTPHDTGSAVPSPAPEQRETPSTPSPAQGVPQHLPVQAKRYFFARSEQAFYGQLLCTLPQGYAIFPNVRLNDLFLIRAEGQSVRRRTTASETNMWISCWWSCPTTGPASPSNWTAPATAPRSSKPETPLKM